MSEYKKLLLVTYSYKPMANPRAFRWSAIAEHWARQGDLIDVVCVWSQGLPRYEVINGVSVYRVGGGIREALGSRFVKSGGAAKNGDQREGAGQSIMQRAGGYSKRLAKWIHDRTWKKVYWPDYACLWYPAALKKSGRLLAETQYDGLVTVSHPFTGHIVGFSLKKRHPGIPWVIDVGDPFCFLEETPNNNSTLYGKLNYSVERKIFEHADAIAVTTQPTLEKYAALFRESASKVQVIPPLLSGNDRATAAPRVFGEAPAIRLAFVGTLYREIRNPRFLLGLFAELLRTDLADQLELHFFGAIHDCGAEFEPYRSWLGRRIFLHGLVSRDTISQAMSEATVLVNIGNRTPYQLPSKVVEYAAAGKPIVNLLQTTSDSSVAFFRFYNAVLHLAEKSPFGVAKQALQLRRFIENPPEVDKQAVQDWLSPFRVKSVAKTYRRLLDACPGLE